MTMRAKGAWKMRRIITKLLGVAFIAFSLLLLCSCDDKDVLKKKMATATQTVYKKGYQKGCDDTAKKIEDKISGVRGTLKNRISKVMVIGSILIILGTLFGAKIIEQLRLRCGQYFKIPLKTQIMIAQGIYITLCASILIWVFSCYSFAMNLPILLLISGTIHPFLNGYLPAMRNADKMNSRLNLNKVKALLFVALVLIMTYNILNNGIEGVL